MMQHSMSLEYKSASKQPHLSVKSLFLNCSVRCRDLARNSNAGSRIWAWLFRFQSESCLNLVSYSFLAGYRSTCLRRNRLPLGPYCLCLGTYGDPRGVGVFYGREIPSTKLRRVWVCRKGEEGTDFGKGRTWRAGAVYK